MSAADTIRILVLEPDPAGGSLLLQYAEAFGFAAQQAGNAEEMLAWLAQTDVDVVLLRLTEPGPAALHRFRATRLLAPQAEVVVVATQNAVRAAADALANGAHGYVIEPYRVDALEAVLRNAADHRRLKRTQLGLRSLLNRLQPGEEPVGSGSAILRAVDIGRRVAPTTTPVLITGEAGTGKRHMARFIHGASERRPEPFVVLECAERDPAQIQTDLFGPQPESTTRAGTRAPGLIESAKGGTLVLADVGGLPPDVQARLVPLLAEGVRRPQGFLGARAVDIRIIATHVVDLADSVARRTFRADLYYHLNSMEILLPPLRERMEDLPALAAAFLRAPPRRGQPVKISASAMEVLKRHPWPGNVWELRSVIERAARVGQESDVRIEDLSLVSLANDRAGALQGPEQVHLSLAEVERLHMQQVLRQCGGNKTHAARALGITTKTLYNRLKSAGAVDANVDAG